MTFPVSARWLTVPAVAVAVYAILTADPTVPLPEAAGIDGGAAAQSDDPEVRATHHRLASRLDVVVVRMQHKERLVADLIAGRRTLSDVADQFLQLNQQEPECLSMIRHAFPGKTDQEASARNVIQYAIYRVNAADRPAARERLDREFAAAFGG